MSQYVETPTKTFRAGGALGQYLRVKTPTALALAGASDVSLGVTESPAFASGDLVAVRLANAQGTRKMVALDAITAGSVVYAAANGKVSATGSIIEGRALEASTNDGDVIEVMPLGANTLAAGTVTESGTQTLTNKTLTSPTINGATVRGTAIVHHLRTRVTTANVNAGATLLNAISGHKYRIVDAALIAIGGNAATADTVDILGTQSSSSVKLLAAAVAGLTQDTLLRAGATNATILTGGASFVACDTNTAITIGKTGSNLATATNVDVLLSYVIEAA